MGHEEQNYFEIIGYLTGWVSQEEVVVVVEAKELWEVKEAQAEYADRDQHM